MAAETFVDIAYRGIELGRRHRLCEVGPRTAYVEHPTPMPVGSRLELLADGGVALAVEVVRIHEQVAGATRAPGMRVQAPALDERGASLWRTLVSVADPVVAPVVVEDVDTTVVDGEVFAGGADRRPTEVMAAIDVEAITRQAAADKPDDGDRPEPAGKKKRGGRKKKS
ncbi:MAG TPA: hypothetical protein VIF63_03355 [Candidatus Limnocylindrales bacterium]